MYQERYDIHDPVGQCSLVLPLLMKRAKIIEIVVVHDIVFALASSGVCAAFSRGNVTWIFFLLIFYNFLLYIYLWPYGYGKNGIFLIFNLNTDTNKRICFLNIYPDEVIRSLFYNKNNDSLITVSVYASDNFSSLKCRSIRIECVYLLISFIYLPFASFVTLGSTRHYCVWRALDWDYTNVVGQKLQLFIPSKNCSFVS